MIVFFSYFELISDSTPIALYLEGPLRVRSFEFISASSCPAMPFMISRRPYSSMVAGSSSRDSMRGHSSFKY